VKNFAEPPQTFFVTPALEIRENPNIFKRRYRCQNLSTPTRIILTNVDMTNVMPLPQLAPRESKRVHHEGPADYANPHEMVKTIMVREETPVVPLNVFYEADAT
jgi:hypothetical protein